MGVQWSGAQQNLQAIAVLLLMEETPGTIKPPYFFFWKSEEARCLER
jgi:hypothetical protein